MSNKERIGYNFDTYRYIGNKRYPFLEKDVTGLGSELNNVIDNLIEITGSSNIIMEISQEDYKMREIDGIGEITYDIINNEFIFTDIEGNLVADIDHLLNGWKTYKYPSYKAQGFKLDKFRIVIKEE